MSKHTPGPWFWEMHNRDQYSDNHIVIGRIGNDGIPETHATVRAGCEEVLESGNLIANANLMTAAPDLLAALKRLMMQVVITSEPDSAFMEAHNAIAKAEGKDHA